MPVRLLRLAAAFLLLAVVLPAAPSLIILVRHAEKEATPADNPHLNAAGRDRAAELAKVVAVLSTNAPLRAIFATKFLRTQETVTPLSKASGIAISESGDDLVARLLAMSGGTVVIAGHSNTIPGLIKALGGPAGIVIADAEFSHLYVLSAPGSPQAKLAALTYGK